MFVCGHSSGGAGELVQLGIERPVGLDLGRAEGLQVVECLTPGLLRALEKFGAAVLWQVCGCEFFLESIEDGRGNEGGLDVISTDNIPSFVDTKVWLCDRIQRAVLDSQHSAPNQPRDRTAD